MPTDKKLIDDPKDIRLTEQDDIQQILGHPPGWILRWGISLVFFIIALLFIIGWIIKYPDVIKTTIILTTEKPSIRVVAKTSGKLSGLFVSEADSVTQAQHLAILENPAEFEDMLRLENLLLELEPQSGELSESFLLPDTLNLGLLQAPYAAFMQKFQDYLFFLEKNNVFQKTKSLRKQTRFLMDLNTSLERQIKNSEEEEALILQKVERDQELLSEQLIAKEAMEKSESILLQHKRQVENLSIQMINNKVRIEELKVQIIDLQQNKSDQQNNKLLLIQEDLQNLKAALEAWKQNYLLSAPIAGTVAMFKIWSPQQFVEAGEPVFTIVPNEGDDKIIGRATLPAKGSGKVKDSLAVNISLTGYPYEEFGIIKAKVKSISPVPQQDQTYLVEVEIPDTLITTYNKVIPFQQEMQGQADIITEDRRILERIFDKLLSVIKNQ